MKSAPINLWFLVSVAIAAMVVTVMLLTQAVPREAAFMAGILALAALLWMTEAVPLFATSLLVIGLQILLLANPGGWPGLGFEDQQSPTSPTYQQVLAAAADPVLVLFFGGLLLARAATKEKVDQALAGLVLHPLRNRPMFLLLAVMLVTAALSMWMSNTATAAMMIVVGLSITGRLPGEEPFRKGLLLSVPFAANIGGLGTPVASPPNAIAVSYLEQAGNPISFFQWMAVAVPLMAVLLLLTWLLLWCWYYPSQPTLTLQTDRRPMTRRGWYVVTVMTVTMALWISEHWHGLPAAAVALIPAVAFTIGGVLKTEDIHGINWTVLILIAGGISLGAGMRDTGLAQAMSHRLPSPGYADGLGLLAVLVTVTMVLSIFMSNTAAANLLLPLGIAAASGGSGGSLGVLRIAMSIALTASISMALPVSTPPNAIAHAHEVTTKREMAQVGILVGFFGAVLVIALGKPVLRFWGLQGI
jgi:solute carrier family 13 (sodium-dependent dicarboxylate transporter), member 2/3/5